VIICVFDADAVEAVLGAEGVTDVLDGRVVVNLTTEALDGGRRHALTLREAGAAYLDGGILSYPRAIGSDAAVILYSGDREAFEANADTLALLAGAQRFVGTGDVDASTAYVAGWVFYYGGLGGFFEAAAFATESGIALSDLPAVTAQLLAGTQDAARRIEAGDYSGDQGPVNGHVDGLPTFLDTVRATGIPGAVLDAFVGYCRLASAAGEGGNDISTIVRTLRSGGTGNGPASRGGRQRAGS
jgi:3-hydroxyisobutyrate dehydrogenase-like beta-hydroxyacid dehydrogenase